MIGVDPLCEYFYVEKCKLSIFVKLNACGLNKFAFKYTWPLIPTYCSKKNPRNWSIVIVIYDNKLNGLTKWHFF